MANGTFVEYKFCFHESDAPLIHQLINGPITASLVIFGIMINILSIVVLRSLRKRSIQNFLIALAVWDILLLLSAFFLYSLSTIIYGRRPLLGSYVFVYPWAYILC